MNLASDFVPLGTGVVCRRDLTRELLLFLGYLAVAAVCESITFVLAQFHMDDWWILNVYTLLEYALVMWILSFWHNERTTSLFRRSVPVFAVLWLVSKFTWENMQGADKYTQTISSTLLLAAAAFTLLRLASSPDFSPLADSRFWITSGLLLYSAGNLTATLLLDEVVKLNFTDALIVYQLHWGLNIIVNLVFAAGLVKVKR